MTSPTIKPVRAWVCAFKSNGAFAVPYDIYRTLAFATDSCMGFEEVIEVEIRPVTKPATTKPKKKKVKP